MEYEQFKEFLSETPYWIKDKKDALKYASHLKYRLIEEKELLKILERLVKQDCPLILDKFQKDQLNLLCRTDDLYLQWKNETKE